MLGDITATPELKQHDAAKPTTAPVQQHQPYNNNNNNNNNMLANMLANNRYAIDSRVHC